MATEVRLRDGTTGLIWPLLPTDRAALRDAYAQLSPQSKFHRFLSGVPHLTPGMLRHLVDDVDGDNHVALVMVAFDDTWAGTAVAVAHLLRYPDDPAAADVAFTVVEDFRGRGAATALVRELVRQRPPGIDRIVTKVAADNVDSLGLLQRLGRTTVDPAVAGVREVRVELSP